MDEVHYGGEGPYWAVETMKKIGVRDLVLGLKKITCRFNKNKRRVLKITRQK